MFHVKHEGWRATTAMTDRQIEQLAIFEQVLRDRAIPIGAVARGDADRLRARHIDDSLRGAELVPEGARTLCDLGSGAGLPGIPLAIARPDLRVTLAERRRNRRALLELATDAVGLTSVSIQGRLEDLAGPFDVCVARAFADAAGSWAAARRILAPGGVLLYWAGEGPAAALPSLDGVWTRCGEGAGLAPGGPVVIMGRQ
jgi:16S rRNA (guanine527-N7)-methyltransferase